MCNKEIRNLMKKTGVQQWKVAEYLGISEATMCRKMRTELNAETKNQVITAIENLKN